MKLEATLNQVLAQQLSSQQLQHLSILQLSTVELSELIEEKILENPLINMGDKLFDQPTEWLKSATIKDKKLMKIQEAEVGISNVVNIDFLVEQIPLTCDSLQVEMLKYLIYSLDSRLFLTCTLNEITEKFKVSDTYAIELITILRSFEPFGVGSYDHIDFLLRHIEDDFQAPEYAAVFVENEIETLAKQEFRLLQRRYDLTSFQVNETIEYIKKLPRTPSVTLEENASFIIPDASVIKIDGQWIIEMNDRLTSQISLNNTYVELLKNTEESYLQKCMRDYVTLVQGIDFRRKTLYAIIDYMITNQPTFLETGLKDLVPMGLKDLAVALKIHESTVSRAIKGKYLQTPTGLIACRRLFVKSLGNGSVNGVLNQIKAIIENENKIKPLSDQQIVTELLKYKIDISRRTVAKYREQLNIPSSKNRKCTY